MQNELKTALAEYLEPISIAANGTRTALGLEPIDITKRSDTLHQIDYFVKGFNDGKAGYWDKWYEDKKAFTAYQTGNFTGRKLFKGEFKLIG